MANFHSELWDAEYGVQRVIGDGDPSTNGMGILPGGSLFISRAGSVFVSTGSAWSLVTGAFITQSYADSKYWYSGSHPTTIATYGITDAFTTATGDARYLQLAGGTLTGLLNLAATNLRMSGAGTNNAINWYNAGYENWYAAAILNSTSWSIGSATLANILTIGNSGGVSIQGTLTLSGQAQVTSSVASDIAIMGAPTLGTQIQLGNGSVVAALGTTYSGGWSYLTYNAYQTAKSTDAWAANYATATSLLFTVQSNGLGLYAAVAGHAAGTLGAFWGSSVFFVSNTGALSAGSATFSGALLANAGITISIGNGLFGPGNGSGFILARNAANTAYIDLLYMNASDQAVIPRTLKVSGDVDAIRSATTGAYYFGTTTTSAYIFFDGAAYNFGSNGSTANVNVNGALLLVSNMVGYDTEVFTAIGRTDVPHYGIRWGVPNYSGNVAMMLGGYGGVSIFAGGLEQLRVNNGSMSALGALYVSSFMTASGDVTGVDHHANRNAVSGIYFMGSDGASYLYRSAVDTILLVSNSATVATFNSTSWTSNVSITTLGNFTSHHIITLGSAVAGYGGQVQCMDDGGAMRWAFGILGSSGARDFSVYDMGNGRSVLTINYTTANATFLANVIGVDHWANRTVTTGVFYLGSDGTSYLYRSAADLMSIASNGFIVANFSSTAWNFLGSVSTPKGIIGTYNAAYRRNLYSMGAAYTGTTDANGNLTSIAGFYGLTFVYDQTVANGGVNISGFLFGHGLEILINGISAGVLAQSGWWNPGTSQLVGNVTIGGNATVGGQQVATILYGSTPPTSSTAGIVGQLYGVT